MAAVAQASVISASVHKRAPEAAHAAAASAYAVFVHGKTFGLTHRRASFSPADVAVASGREAS